MPKQWSKVRRDAMVSTRLANLAREHPLALGLYWVLKAEADDFGRFTADPEKFAVKCGGLAHLTAEEAAEIMQAMKVCGVIRFYKVDGERYLEIAEYMKHEHDGEPKWNYVGRAEFPPPPDWTPPASLVAFIRANITKRNVTPARYGIEPGINAACDKILADLGAQDPEPRSNPSPAPVEPQSNHTSTVVQPQLNGASIDVDGDYDYDGDNDRAREANEDDDPPRPRVEDYPPQPDPSADTSYLKQNYPCTAQWLFTNCKRWSHKIRDRWLAAIVTAIESASDEWITSDQQAAELLATHPPKGSEENLPSKWLERVEKEAELQPAPPVNVFAALINRTPEEQERIDAQAQRMWEEERAEWAASGGGLL